MKVNATHLFPAILIVWLLLSPVTLFLVDWRGSGIRNLFNSDLSYQERMNAGINAITTQLTKPYTYLYGNLCHIIKLPVNNKCIYGKGEWVFLGNSYEKSFDQCLRKRVISDEQANALAQHSTALAQIAASKNAHMLILVAPNKGILYPEYLPCKPQSGMTSLEKWVQRDPEHLVDLYPALRAAKSTTPMASPFNTHWSDAATGVAWNVLRERFQKWSPMEQTWKAKLDTQSFRIEAGDLPKMMRFHARNPVATLPLPKTYGIFTESEGCSRQVSSPLHVSAINGAQTVYSAAAPIQKHLLVIGDSNVRAISPYLNASFAQLSYRNYYNTEIEGFSDLLDEVKPDFVLWIIAERHILTLWSTHR